MEGDFAFCSCGGYGFVGGGGRDGDLWGRDINFGGCGGFDWGNGDIGGVALRVELLGGAGIVVGLAEFWRCSMVGKETGGVMKGKEGMRKKEVGGKGALSFLLGMVDEMDVAKEMKDEELALEVMSKIWGSYKVDSEESALLGELIERFKKAKGILRKRRKCRGRG